MPVIGLAEVLVQPSFKGTQAKVGKELQGIASTEGKKAGKQAGSKFGTAMKAAVGAMAGLFAIDKATDFFKAAVTGAGDLEQSVGAINSVFKGSAGQMHNWARTAATDVGLTKNEFNELGTLIGAQLKNGGTAMDELAPKTQELVTLGADLASMFGGTTKDAVGALSSALKGERDPIEAYGVTLNQAKIEAEASALGFSKVGKAFEDEAIQAATLSLIMKQTTDAHGNFAKEAGTFAGAQQRMSAQWGDLTARIGEMFLPALSGVISFVSTHALPVIGEIVGGIRAFGYAFSDAGTEITSSGFAGFLERVGLGLGGIWDLISKGDFNGKLFAAFGWEEDHPFVDFLLDARDGLISAGTWIKNNRAWLEPLTIAVVAGAVAYQAFGMASSGVGTALATVTKWIKAAQAAQWGLNAAMAANPVGLIIAAVAALTAGFIYLWNTNEGFRNFFIDAWGAIKGVVASVWEGFLKPVFDGIGSAVQSVGTWFTSLWKDNVAPAWGGITSVVGTAWDFISGIFKSVVGAVTGFLAPIFNWLLNFLKPVWIGISGLFKIAWAVIETVFLAIHWGITKVLAPMFMNFWEKTVKPVWSWIATAIKVAWSLIGPIFNLIGTVLRVVVGAAFNWLYNNVIKPVWGFISSVIKVAWERVIMPVFSAIKWYIDNVVAPVFRWLWREVIKPVWESVSGFIRDTWNDKIKPIFKALGKFIEETVVPAFRSGIQSIKDIWNGIRNAAAAPINFVIGTVYNNGLRKALNKVREIVGGDPLKPLPTIPEFGKKAVGSGSGGPMRAFAKGGFAAPGWALVGEEGPELVNFSNPGRVYTADQSRKMLELAAGRNPSEALLPMGGLGDVLASAWRKATDWVRGGLAEAAGLILNPIKNGVAGSIEAIAGKTVLGSVSADLVRKAVDGALDWIRGKDKVDTAQGLAVYNGPKGAFHRPSKGPFTSMFGPRWGSFHGGVDIAGGGPTYAALNGIVSMVGNDPVGGLFIRLNHGGGFSTYYGHNPPGGIRVKTGQQVKAGQHIGMQGQTGLATGVHLHFQTEQNGQPINPMQYLLRDSGGNLPPGLSMVLNKTGRNEWVFNDRQLQTVMGSRGADGPAIQNVYNGPVGFDPAELAREQETVRRRNLALHNLQPGGMRF